MIEVDTAVGTGMKATCTRDELKAATAAYVEAFAELTEQMDEPIDHVVVAVQDLPAAERVRQALDGEQAAGPAEGEAIRTA